MPKVVVDRLPEGKLLGSTHQAPPLRRREKRALSTSRMAVDLGRPPALAGGITGAITLHSSSLKSVGSAFRFIPHTYKFPPFQTPSRDLWGLLCDGNVTNQAFQCTIASHDLTNVARRNRDGLRPRAVSALAKYRGH